MEILCEIVFGSLRSLALVSTPVGGSTARPEGHVNYSSKMTSDLFRDQFLLQLDTVVHRNQTPHTKKIMFLEDWTLYARTFRYFHTI